MTYAWFDVTRNAGKARIMHMSYRSKTYTWNDVILVEKYDFFTMKLDSCERSIDYSEDMITKRSRLRFGIRSSQHILNISNVIEFSSTCFATHCLPASSPTCPCNEGVQTPDHLIYDCKLLDVQRRSLKQHIMADGENWPTPNSELVASYLKSFSRFVKFIDLNKLQ